MFCYAIDKGALFSPTGGKMGYGYSGHGNALNNPAAQDRHGVGPIPIGRYTIGPARKPVDHLGPLAMPLMPDSANEMHGRSALFIHGDNAKLNHSASDGCIILAHGFRQMIDDSTDDQLVVVALEADVAAVFASKQKGASV